jgi:hypothetical protein
MIAAAKDMLSCTDLDQFVRSISAYRRLFGGAFLLTRCAELCLLRLLWSAPMCHQLTLSDRFHNLRKQECGSRMKAPEKESVFDPALNVDRLTAARPTLRRIQVVATPSGARRSA